VRCAVEIQQEIGARNVAVSEERRMRFRIGVNLGDVIVEGQNLHGEGINIAARLETLAEPGGVTISGSVHDHIAGKEGLVFTDAGSRTLKNIAKSIRMWRWVADGDATMAPVDAPFALPDKPSIAVLPFTNMSQDIEQEYFSDGITEDIITELSRYRELFVIARNSTFAFKGLNNWLKNFGVVVSGTCRASPASSSSTSPSGRPAWVIGGTKACASPSISGGRTASAASDTASSDSRVARNSRASR
jgi:adenylate cyclase